MTESRDFAPPDEAPPGEPTAEEVAQMIASTPSERLATRAMVLGECTGRWQKVARIVGCLMDEFERAHPQLPFAMLQASMESLEDLGQVEIAGDVWDMRHSEIRLVEATPGAA